MTQNAGNQRGFLLKFPLLIVVMAYLYFSARSTSERVSRPWTMSPWEAALVVDASRMLDGQPVYEDPKTGHATHMYGPLATYAVAPLVAKWGPDVRMPRAISLAATLLVCMLAAALSFRRGWFGTMLGFALCWFQFYRIRDWATESRPDATSLLLLSLALLLFYQSTRTLRGGAIAICMLGGIAVMLIGFFFKQTAAVAAIVAPVFVLLDPERRSWKRVAVSLIPLATIGLALMILRFATPWIYFYMVSVPAGYPVNWGNWMLAVLELARFNSLFVAVLLGWAVMQSRRDQIDRADSCLLAAIVVLALTTSVARAKVGGAFNSMLPAYIAMSVFCARALPAIFDTTVQVSPPLGRWFIAIVLAGLPIVDIAAAAPTLNPGALALRQGDVYYLRLINIAGGLPGKFVSPDDPTIALRARGYKGRCAYCELDANLHKLPDFALDELAEADWMLQINASRPPAVSDEQLRSLGFEVAEGIIPQGSVYILWKRSTPATRPN